ncbi:MAG TPA: MBL fold metallo-hydrolase [Candidatus Nitrosotalea sp.]|nr:MBL fold metallo-hydrolase [Candidatus Nitrosotalea sp.]
MIVRVLGSAAGGGVPQWNCACANCTAAREGRAPRRSESTLAIGLAGLDGMWMLLNCSTDIASQIEACGPLRSSHGRFTPICGILLTDANIDHIGGLAVLRQASPSTCMYVRSSAVVREIALAQPSFAHFGKGSHRWIDAALNEYSPKSGDDDIVGDLITVRTLAVPGKTPGYDGRRNVAGAVVAYEIAERDSASTLLFAPVFAAIEDSLAAAIARADVAFLDGSFYSDDEMIAAKLSSKTAQEMGHLPAGGPNGTLEQIGGGRTRVIFTHLNNSNPMLDPNSAAYAAVRAAGAEIAYDGMELTL